MNSSANSQELVMTTSRLTGTVNHDKVPNYLCPTGRMEHPV